MPAEEKKQTSTWNVEKKYFRVRKGRENSKVIWTCSFCHSGLGQRLIIKRNRFGREGSKAHNMDYHIDPKMLGNVLFFSAFGRKLFLATIAPNFVSYREQSFTRRKKERSGGNGAKEKIKSWREAKKLSWKSWEGGNLEVDLWNIFLHSKLVPRELRMSSKG